ncbi:MAG: YesL family protein [Lachnospiraceae bacterium]|nr:YesL family protein [Lachnospiraceae bacterium]
MSSEGFNYDNMFIRLLNRLGDVFILSIVFTLCCVPIVTIGPALTALYYTAMKGITVGEGYVAKYFFKSFKENLKQGIAIFLINAFAIFVFSVDLWFWLKQWKEQRLGVARIMIIISVVLLMVAIMIFIFVFPLQAKFDNKIKVQIRNAFLLSIKFFPTTLAVMLITALMAYGVYFAPALALSGYLLIGFGAMGYINGALFYRCLKTYLVTDEEAETETDDEEKIFSDKPVQ